MLHCGKQLDDFLCWGFSRARWRGPDDVWSQDGADSQPQAFFHSPPDSMSAQTVAAATDRQVWPYHVGDSPTLFLVRAVMAAVTACHWGWCGLG